MRRLYHAPASRSCRVRWLLEELGLDYEIVGMQINAESLQTPAYLAKNPLGRVPTLEDGGTVIFESGAILEYLLETYGDGRLEPPVGSSDRAAYLQWFHWAEATALPPISDFVQHSFLRPEAERIPAVVVDAAARTRKCLAVADQALEGRSYIAGDEFSAADIMLGYTVQLAKITGQLTDATPQLGAYLERLAARPGFQKAFGS
jgi:glutathione S-transferase